VHWLGTPPREWYRGGFFDAKVSGLVAWMDCLRDGPPRRDNPAGVLLHSRGQILYLVSQIVKRQHD